MKKATPVSESSPQVPLHDTSRKAQRTRLLARLRQGPVDTFTIARELNICRPGARIAELRAAGHHILTYRVTLDDDQGRPHGRVALYVLGTEPQGRIAA